MEKGYLALGKAPSLLTVWFHRGGTRFLMTPLGGGVHHGGRCATDPTNLTPPLGV